MVQHGPLCPLNFLMLNGLIYVKFHLQPDKEPGNDFRNESQLCFETGTQLQ